MQSKLIKKLYNQKPEHDQNGGVSNESVEAYCKQEELLGKLDKGKVAVLLCSTKCKGSGT